MALLSASLPTLTSRSSVRLKRRRRRTTEAPPRPSGRRGRISERPQRPELTTLPLQSRPNASPFWIMLLLNVGALEHEMIKHASRVHRLLMPCDFCFHGELSTGTLQTTIGGGLCEARPELERREHGISLAPWAFVTVGAYPDLPASSFARAPWLARR